MTERTVFILAAGEGKRWHQGQEWPTDLPKQLLPVAGKPIIQRTIDMVRWHDYMPVIVTHHEAIIDTLDNDIDVCYPTGRRWLIETLNSTQHLWTDINVALWSDVIYSNTVIDLMLTDGRSPVFYGRWGDGYGLVWRKDDQRFMDGLKAVLEDAEVFADCDMPVGRNWELYRWFMGHNLRYHYGPTASNKIYEFVSHDDYTCDVDTPEDWQRVQETILEQLKI